MVTWKREDIWFFEVGVAAENKLRSSYTYEIYTTRHQAIDTIIEITTLTPFRYSQYLHSQCIALKLRVLMVFFGSSTPSFRFFFGLSLSQFIVY